MRSDVPAPLFDLALNPDDPQQLMAATEAGLALSTDGGRRVGTDIALHSHRLRHRPFLHCVGMQASQQDGGLSRWHFLALGGGRPRGRREHYGRATDFLLGVRNTHPDAVVPSAQVDYHSGGRYEVLLRAAILAAGAAASHLILDRRAAPPAPAP